MKHLLLILLLISTTGFARSISYHCDNDLTFNPRTFTIKVTQRLFFGSSFCLKDINARKCSFKKRLSHGESVSSPDKFLSSEHVLKFRN
ncbi:MAG: hypothetical protein HN730_07535, partial [Bdellovibrionales bacterium]|nr:hypothetical protein [Bdellovibrionales bacterium]